MKSFSRHALVSVLALNTLIACAKGPATKSAESAPDTSMAGMPGMTGMAMPGDTSAAKDSAGNMPLAPTLTFTAAQIEHGRVQWSTPTTGAIGSSASIPGEIVPNEDHTVHLGSPVRGQVLDVPVRPGDRVAAGQTLVRLQSPDAGMAQSDLTRAVAEVISRRAQLQYAESTRARAERLLTLKSIPRQDYERAVADADQARAALTQAEADERRATATAHQLGATSSVAGEVMLRAPMAGVVLYRMATSGTVVEPGAPLVVITDPATLWLNIAAPEQLTSLFRRGGRLRFTVPAYPADTFAAKVDAIGAGMDPATRTLAVRGLILNHDGRLKPAMLATVTVDGAVSAATLIIPEDAVQSVRGKPTVFVVTPDGKGGAKLDRREVTVGAHQNGRVAILRGLSASDIVVTEGAFAVKAEFLKGGMPKMDM